MKSKILFWFVFLMLFFSGNSVLGQADEQYETAIDIGIGTNFEGAGINVGVSIFNKFDIFLEYCRFFDNDRLLYNDLSMKLGKHIGIYKFSNISFSVGFAYFFNPALPQFNSYTNSSEGKYIPQSGFALPIQIKLNLAVYKALGFGFKYTYDIGLSEKSVNMNSMFVYITCMLK